jgi:hypothetical protein
MKMLRGEMKMKRIPFPVVLAVLIAIMALFGCSGNQGPGSAPDTAQDIGHGGTVFRFEVTDDNQIVTAWNVSTDETTIGAALSAVGLIEGEGGFYTVVNGLEANYGKNKAYWILYIDGEYALAGADAIEIEQEKTYAFVYTTD